MNISYQRLTGILFIVGAVLVNIPYTLLIMNFDYPDILREPTGQVLTRFQAGGTGLIFTWLAFAWVGIPLLVAIVMLQKVLEREDTPYLWSGTVLGIIGAIAQMIGLLRWPFVVPVLAKTYTDPSASATTKEAAVVVFQAIHQYGGVVLGEHIGQTFTILWIFIISLAMFKSSLFKPWLAWFGMLVAVIYLSAQTELLATVIPTFPVVPETGLIGSLLWLAWTIVLGLFLVRAPKPGPGHSLATPHR
jgi:hypothetical protein